MSGHAGSMINADQYWSMPDQISGIDTNSRLADLKKEAYINNRILIRHWSVLIGIDHWYSMSCYVMQQRPDIPPRSHEIRQYTWGTVGYIMQPRGDIPCWLRHCFTIPWGGDSLLAFMCLTECNLIYSVVLSEQVLEKIGHMIPNFRKWCTSDAQHFYCTNAIT